MKGKEKKYHAWSSRKSISSLPSSENSLDVVRKKMIQESLDFDIVDIRTYIGYKGDPILEISTMHLPVAEALEEIAKGFEFEVVIQKTMLNIYKVFCIGEPNNIYALKID